MSLRSKSAIKCEANLTLDSTRLYCWRRSATFSSLDGIIFVYRIVSFGDGVTVAQAHHDDAEIWIVKLHNHESYAFTRLKRAFVSDDSRHRVVLVDAQKLLTCADRDATDYVLPPVEEWFPGKVRGIREFLDPRQARVPEMPYVTFKVRASNTLLGVIGLDKEGVVSFRNGQHRARYLAYAGAASFPVEVHETEAGLLERYCGVDHAGPLSDDIPD